MAFLTYSGQFPCSPPQAFLLLLAFRDTSGVATITNVGELVSQHLKTPIAENNHAENVKAGPSKSPKIRLENLDEFRMSLRSEILSDLAKSFAGNQKEMLYLIVPTSKKSTNRQNIEEVLADGERFSYNYLNPNKIQNNCSQKYSDN